MVSDTSYDIHLKLNTLNKQKAFSSIIRFRGARASTWRAPLFMEVHNVPGKYF